MSGVLPDPSLRIHTVYFHQDDRDYCQALGTSLYDMLTRPVHAPLAEGPSIWVSVAVSYEHLSDVSPMVDVVVPVLGPGAASAPGARRDAVRWISDVHARLAGSRQRILAVLEGSLWPIFERELMPRARTFRAPRSGERETRIKKVRYELTKAIFRLAAPHARILISFETADTRCRSIAEAIQQTVKADASGDRGAPWRVQMSHDKGGLEVSSGSNETPIFIAVRGDSQDVRAQHELLEAKLESLPILWVDAASVGESAVDTTRIPPHAANLPRLAWRGQAAPVVEAALVEWLRDHHFRREASRIQALVHLSTLGASSLATGAEVRSRRPELLDVAAWWRTRRGRQVIMHPDPELPAHDREMLRSAYPKLRLVTPSSAYRGREGGSDFPLAGWEVALSISDGPDLGGVTGMTYNHLLDVNHSVARTLLSSGAQLAYAGDFRRQGHAERLWDLISAYNLTSVRSADLLHAYLGGNIAVPRAYPVRVRSMRQDDDLRAQALVHFDPSTPRWLYLSDLRRVMAAATDARVVMGGNSLPLGSDPRPSGGYRGPLPGILEEVLRTLEVSDGRPLYLAGGFGGATRLAVQAIQGQLVPELRSGRFGGNERFVALAAGLVQAADRYPELRLPGSLEALRTRLAELGAQHFGSDAAAELQNGLTRAENLALWTTKDPALVAALVMRGLLNRGPRDKSLTWTVELVEGDWRSAYRLDACLFLSLGSAAPDWPAVPVPVAGGPTGPLVPGPASMDCEWLMRPAASSSSDVAGAVERFGAATAELGSTRVGIAMAPGGPDIDWSSVAAAIKSSFSPLTTVVILDPRSERLAAAQQVLGETSQMVAIRTRTLDVLKS